MVDVREQIERERGLLKKIQLAIPFYRGYRLEEDARASDIELRKQLGKEIETRVLARLGEAQADLIQEHGFLLAGDIKAAIDPVRRLQNAISKQQTGGWGYGVTQNFYMTYQRMFSLYDYDRRLIEIVENLAVIAEKIQDSARIGDLSQMGTDLREIRKNVSSFEKALIERMDIILNKKVFADEGMM
ncbi:hypothetical protein [Methanosarcina sp. UBA289]|mgnify:CR=1 FL=1|uniref:hypothetical protein n=1 Tax=Methanosarcina sp. UBA289 TaxID=1915574 RepID=UPI0025DE933B|nr:hypothetical protein [Methanosarcina sp. UBA289]